MANNEFFPVGDLIKDTQDGKRSLSVANHIMTSGGVWIPQTGTDEGATNTNVTGSNVEVSNLPEIQKTNIVQSIFSEDLDSFTGKTITGGSTFELTIEGVFKSSEVSIGIAFLKSAKFSVLVQPRNKQNTEYMDVSGDIQIVDDEIRAVVFDFSVKSENARIRIYNTGIEEATISSFTITHHQAGGVV